MKKKRVSLLYWAIYRRLRKSKHRQKTKLAAFYDFLLELVVTAEKAPVSELVQAIWQKSGYWQALLALGGAEAESRLENLQEFFIHGCGI